METQTTHFRWHGASGSPFGSALLVAVVFLGPGEALAEISPFVAARISYDDNLFRFSDETDSAALLGTDARSDTYLRAEAGVQMDHASGRQEYRLDARINRNVYDRFSFLDYTGGEFRARGALRFGEAWSANIDIGYLRELANFENLVLPIRDIKSTRRASAIATRHLDPRWSVRLGGSWRDFRFSERDINNREESAAVAGVDYRSRADNRLGLQLTVTDGRFPNRTPDPSIQFDDGYTRTDLETLVDWTITGKSTVTAALGYSWVKSDNFSSQDFDGPIALLRYRWMPTGKLTLNTVLRRSISDLSGDIANFTEISALELQPRWEVSGRTTIVGLLGYERRDFQEAANLPAIDGDGREDTIRTLRVGAEYELTRRSRLDLRVQTENRDSTEEIRDYDYTMVYGSLTLFF